MERNKKSIEKKASWSHIREHNYNENISRAHFEEKISDLRHTIEPKKIHQVDDHDKVSEDICEDLMELLQKKIVNQNNSLESVWNSLEDLLESFCVHESD